LLIATAILFAILSRPFEPLAALGRRLRSLQNRIPVRKTLPTGQLTGSPVRFPAGDPWRPVAHF